MGGGSGIFAAHPNLEALDLRTAMLLLARGVLHQSARSADPARHWFVLWPSIPAPALYFRFDQASFELEARAA